MPIAMSVAIANPAAISPAYVTPAAIFSDLAFAMAFAIAIAVAMPITSGARPDANIGAWDVDADLSLCFAGLHRNRRNANTKNQNQSGNNSSEHGFLLLFTYSNLPQVEKFTIKNRPYVKNYSVSILESISLAVLSQAKTLAGIWIETPETLFDIGAFFRTLSPHGALF